jgi:hypothetical protein
MSDFSTPEKVYSILETLKTADRTVRAPNRALINTLYNGKPPYTAEEVRDNKILVNVNWQEGSDCMLKAREQYENAHLSTDPAFTIRVPDAPKSKATKYGQQLTTLVSSLIKKNLPYFHTRREKWGAVTVHGIGPSMWPDEWTWRPFFVPEEDLLIPTDTPITFEGMNHFFCRRRITPGELFRKTLGLPEEKRDPNWNLDAVKEILDNYKDINQNRDNFDWGNNPEKMVELYKQNGCYYDNDSVPKIWLWDFYHQEDDEESPCWYRKILLDRDSVGQRASDKKEQWIYKSDKPFAYNLGHILQCQFCDGNNIAPFMFHSVRSLGLRLHDALQMLNRMRCQFMQKVFEDMMNLFQVSDPTDRARLDQIYIGMQYGAFPDGLSFLTRDKRYQPDTNMLEMQFSQLKQLIGEGSQQYTSDIDNGTNKERTAFEVSALLNQTTKLTGSMLNLSYIQEEYQYREICRRLTKLDTVDFEVKRFQNECRELGIEDKWLNSERWQIEAVRVLGGGNAQLEGAQAQALLNIRPLMNPESQSLVLNKYVYSITHDSKLANLLAPLDGAPIVSDTKHDTELTFGALMNGAMVTPKPGLNPIEVLETMVGQVPPQAPPNSPQYWQTRGQIGITIARTEAQGGMTDQRTINGLTNSIQYSRVYLAQLAQDKSQNEMVKMFSDVLGQAENMVKGYAQRFTEHMQNQQQQSQMDPAVMAKIQGEAALTAQQLQSKAALHDQKIAHGEQKFQMQQRTQAMKTLTGIHSDALKTGAEIGRIEKEPKPANGE